MSMSEHDSATQIVIALISSGRVVTDEKAAEAYKKILKAIQEANR